MAAWPPIQILPPRPNPFRAKTTQLNERLAKVGREPASLVRLEINDLARRSKSTRNGQHQQPELRSRLGLFHATTQTSTPALASAVACSMPVRRILAISSISVSLMTSGGDITQVL